QSTITNTSGPISNCGTLLVENSTISNNQGIGISNFTGTVIVRNSTITKNSSGGQGQFVGGGIHTLQGIGSVNIENSIITRNTGYGGTPQDCSGTITSDGHNI